VGIHAAHVRNLVDSLMLNRTYEFKKVEESGFQIFDMW